MDNVNVERLAEWWYTQALPEGMPWTQVKVEMPELAETVRSKARSLLTKATEWGWVQKSENQKLKFTGNKNHYDHAYGSEFGDGWYQCEEQQQLQGFVRVEPLEGK